MSEAELLRAVRELATLHSWRVAHFAQTRRSFKDEDGEEQFVGDTGAKGWPDLVLTKGARLLIVELKRQGAKPTPEQVEWLDALIQTDARCYLWFPDDLREIALILSDSKDRSSPTDWRRRRDAYVKPKKVAS